MTNPRPAVADELAAREVGLLAPYAMHSADSAGRRYAEQAHAYRGPYQRDRDRIVHSAAFRRLAYKTQVFTGELGDYHRTRLTHTLEVTSLARTVARELRLNEDLTEALALAHDIGHPPFGHAGEEVLNVCLAGEGGFNHNAQALRIVELLEVRYHTFPGLNLSVEVLEGQARRATPDQPGQPSPLLEVQVVDAADSLAYVTHDADDALELGLIQLDDLRDIELWSAAVDQVQRRAQCLDAADLRRAVVRELIDWQVRDLLDATAARLAGSNIQSIGDVRAAPPVAAPSETMARQKQQFQELLFQRVYRHPQVLAIRSQAQEAVRELFDLFVRRPESLLDAFRPLAGATPARSAVDYLASLTDRSFWEVYNRHFS